jgi:chromosome segregation protein
MRLSGIKLAGFKSFVDPQQLPLPNNLTGIVGPNGCGKSNIIDAVRWVLGETSIKHLRASDTEDVIFNGSRTRKPAGRASVELLFDNSDGQISGPYAAYSEISVKRELTRDGGSQYYLNTRKCLKRDVTDLFLGTGLGGKSQYAIIEQGMVSRMVEAKPEELRHWLEEAAGISKYKERRRETESRIRQTRENLSRLQDLQNELTARLEVLVKQAANAEKYREFKQQERQTQAELLLLRCRQLAAECAAHEQTLATLTGDLESAKAQVSEAETAAGAAEAAQQAAAQALNAEQAQVYEAEARLSRAEQALAHARELQALQAREQEQQRGRLTEIERRLGQEKQREIDARTALGEAEQGVAAARDQAEQAQQAASAADERLHAGQAQWEQVAHEAQAPLLAAEGERVRAQQLERSLRAAEERLGRLENEKGSLQTSPIQASLFDADAELAGIAEELSRLQQRAEALDRDLTGLRESRAAQEKALHESRQALSAARGRMSSLETLQQAAYRQDDADFRSWLDRNGLRENGRVADELRVSSGWESAVEHVLDVLLQAPVLPDSAALRNAPAGGPKGGAALVVAGAGSGEVPAQTLAAYFDGPGALRDLLVDVRVAESAEQAIAMLDQLGPSESVITRDGIWRGHGWMRYAPVDPAHSGVIARSAELRELKQQAQVHGDAVREAETALAELQNRMRTFEAERRDAGNKLDQLRARQAQRLAFRQAQAVRLEQVENRVRTLTQEIEQLQAQRAQQAEELNTARSRLTEMESDAERARAARAQSQQQLAQAREEAQQARAQAARAVQAANEAQVRYASRVAAVTALERSLQELETQRGAAEEQARMLAERAQANEVPLREHEVVVAEARTAVDDSRGRLRVAREALTAAENARAGAVSGRRARETDKDAAVERLQQSRLEFENLRTRRDGVEAQFAETGFSRGELETGLAEDATPQAWEEKYAQIGRRIDRLGAINLAAIQELEEARQRDSYLASQHADVSQALTTLEDAMRKLDRETQERFRETFERVDHIFRERFPKLFGGGEAYLELTGEDLLETGVRVMARPPGKRNSTIQLLSGGEKAMTAVALLLALFELNPAPFCLMDEVDAPLDDANVGRYCEVLREMSERVQFIIITHNKITMELARQLHGVTMQEPGVSRLVSVDVEQALAYAAPSREAVEAA